MADNEQKSDKTGATPAGEEGSSEIESNDPGSIDMGPIFRNRDPGPIEMRDILKREAPGSSAEESDSGGTAGEDD